MEKTFTILESKRADVEKLVVKYQKKAQGYGIPFKAEFGKPYGAKIPVDFIDDYGYIQNAGSTMVEAFDLIIDAERICKDGYTVIAKIEHLKGGNIVTTFSGEAKQEWSNINCKCEHCNSNRARKFTFIVKHTNGTEKQIGSTCLKEYCGIDPMAIGYRNELTDILLNDDINHHDFYGNPVQTVYDPINVLALAIKIKKAHGYVRSGEPGSNKDRIAEGIKNACLEDNEIEEAQKMANEITALSDEEANNFLLGNAKSILNSTYCKASHFGYLAYAPVAYEKYLEELAKRAKQEEIHNAELDSKYVGAIGDKIIFKANVKLLTSFENDYGTTFLYKFTDENGNILIWFASRYMDEAEKDEMQTFKATIKNHSERDGIKQTIITRCKIA